MSLDQGGFSSISTVNISRAIILSRCPLEQRIGDQIRLAEPERKRKHAPAEMLYDAVGDAFGFLMLLRLARHVSPLKASQPLSGVNRVPYCCSKRFSVATMSAPPRLRA